jgi:hypothetical protein
MDEKRIGNPSLKMGALEQTSVFPAATTPKGANRVDDVSNLQNGDD